MREPNHEGTLEIYMNYGLCSNMSNRSLFHIPQKLQEGKQEVTQGSFPFLSLCEELVHSFCPHMDTVFLLLHDATNLEEQQGEAEQIHVHNSFHTVSLGTCDDDP